MTLPDDPLIGYPIIRGKNRTSQRLSPWVPWLLSLDQQIAQLEINGRILAIYINKDDLLITSEQHKRSSKGWQPSEGRNFTKKAQYMGLLRDSLR